MHVLKNVEWWSIQRYTNDGFVSNNWAHHFRMMREVDRVLKTLNHFGWATQPNGREMRVYCWRFLWFLTNVVYRYCFLLCGFYHTIRTHCSWCWCCCYCCYCYVYYSLLFICTRNYRNRLCSAMNYGVARDQSMITYSISILNFFSLFFASTHTLKYYYCDVL